MSWQISHILYQYLLRTTCHTQTKFSARMLTNTPSPTIFCARFCSRPRPAPRHAARSVAKCSSAWSPASFNRFDASDANLPLPQNIAKMMESDGIFGKSRLCVESSWDRWCHDCIWQRIRLLKSKKIATKKIPKGGRCGVMTLSLWVLRLPIQKNRLPCLLVHGDSKNPHDKIVLLRHPRVSQAICNS